MRPSSSQGHVRPSVRPLKIFAVDPMHGRAAGNRVSIDIENERLRSGPIGERIEVVDYDSSHTRYYSAVDLDDANLLMQGGMDPSESDPHFHQQMVYAVAMRTLQNFDRGLGRRLSMNQSRERPRLKLIPHAFYGANAYYDRKLHAVLFGYFTADRDKPGANIPGQMIFTCLSHDIIVHEVTHAIVNKLRPHFMEPSNEDVLAFHEGFSDVVAIFQHFSYPTLLQEQMQKAKLDIRGQTLLAELAKQFGEATGTGKALRSARDKPDPARYANTIEPHDRGQIFVSAVFDAFAMTFERRTRDLIRIATGGTGVLGSGDVHPDLIARVAGEASRTAQAMLTMCIRAFDYLPPVDITFGDFLRALVTADFELSPGDEFGQRSAFIEAFRVRGIYPSGVVSLAEESLLWPKADDSLPLLELDDAALLREVVKAAVRVSRDQHSVDLPTESRRRHSKFRRVSEGADGPSFDFETLPQSEASQSDMRAKSRDSSDFRVKSEADDSPSFEFETLPQSETPEGVMEAALTAYALSNAALLNLDPHPDRPPKLEGFHPVFRVSPSGQLLIEYVVQFSQHDDSYKERLGGIPLRGGTTLIVSAEGFVRYAIAKPLPSAELDDDASRAAQKRASKQLEYVGLCDAIDPACTYLSAKDYSNRMVARMDLRQLHGHRHG